MDVEVEGIPRVCNLPGRDKKRWDTHNQLQSFNKNSSLKWTVMLKIHVNRRVRCCQPVLCCQPSYPSSTKVNRQHPSLLIISWLCCVVHTHHHDISRLPRSRETNHRACGGEGFEPRRCRAPLGPPLCTRDGRGDRSIMCLFVVAFFVGLFLGGGGRA